MNNTPTYRWENPLCKRCGKPKFIVESTTRILSDYDICTCDKEINRYGWICPICHGVNAPWVSMCQGVHYTNTASSR